MTTFIVLLGLIAIVRGLWQKNNTRRRAKSTRRRPRNNAAVVKRYYQDPPEQLSIIPTTKPRQRSKKMYWDKDFLLSIEWKVFEDVCAEYLRLEGHNASVTSIGKDGGIDLIIKNNNGRVIGIGQCKARKDKAVNVNEVRELYGIMAAEGVKHGVYITTSTFTKDAHDFCKNKPIRLINGDDFLRLCHELDTKSKNQLDKVAKVINYDIPTCVSCNIKMVKRTNAKGQGGTSVFWGCKNYPLCKKTLSVRK